MKKAQNRSSFVTCVPPAPLFLLCMYAVVVAASPATRVAAARNVGDLQQQNFFTVLTSIEHKLRNIENFYSMQVAQVLETKLSQYSRHLEALDTKLIRLETLIMLNLDKISENINTKNFKDEMTKTNLLRRMEAGYETISHKLDYIQRRYDANIGKIQTKIDSALTQMDNIEKTMMARDSDIETEISSTNSAIRDMKTTFNAIGNNIDDIKSSTLNIAENTEKTLNDVQENITSYVEALTEIVLTNIHNLTDTTLDNVQLAKDTNTRIKEMRHELKNDFNDYAGKVADMNYYNSKQRDITEDDINRIESMIKDTKTEVQNGIRSLAVQIGKSTNKNTILNTDDNLLEQINGNLNKNFQTILANQDVFLESCHRLQMDESQIEDEISATLEKLIDMFEKKSASEIKDIKNLEKMLKNHENRVSRNMYQINSNVMSLFEKSSISNGAIISEIKKNQQDLDALFTLVQSIAANEATGQTGNAKTLYEKLDKLENAIMKVSTGKARLEANATEICDSDLTKQFEEFSKLLRSIQYQINNISNKENTNTSKTISDGSKQSQNISINNEEVLDNGTRKIIEDIFGTNPDLKSSTPVVDSVDNSTKNCKQNYQGLIDVRSGEFSDCIENLDTTGKSKKKNRRKKKRPTLALDIRGNFQPEDVQYDDISDTAASTSQENLLETTTEENASETTTIDAINKLLNLNNTANID